MQKAVIYCRVSSEKQRLEGKGLESQEHRCREYANRKDYKVVKVFGDSFTGGGNFLKRPAMSNLLQYLEDHPTEKLVVIFDDLKRFARDTIFHWKLRSALKACEATPECLNFNFEETPEGEFIETIIAAQGQLERQQNRRQVCQKMKSRLEKGYWCFYHPPAYEFKRNSVHGKFLVPIEPLASILKEGLELFANGVIDTQLEFLRFLEKKKFKTQRGGKLNLSLVNRMLTQILYTGHLEYSKWGIPIQKAQHEGIISFGTFERIQEKLQSTGKAKARKDINKDFPLRGFILCEKCGNSMTAAWSTGSKNKFAYYRCKKKGCSEFGKGIPKEKLEKEVSIILKELAPTSDILELTKAIVIDIWKEKMGDIEVDKKSIKKELKQTSEMQESCINKILETSSTVLIKSLEERVETLESKKNSLISKLEKVGNKNFNFEEALELVFEFLKKPHEMWETGGLEEKRMVLKLVFPKDLSYDREKGVGTIDLALPFLLNGLLKHGKNNLVEVARIELASKEETYFRLRDVVHLNTIPLQNEQKTEKSGLNFPSSSTR